MTRKSQNIQSNTNTISKTISINVGLGIKKYHSDFNVELLEYKGLSESSVWVSVKGKMEDLVALNEKASLYRPSVSGGSQDYY